MICSAANLVLLDSHFSPSLIRPEYSLCNWIGLRRAGQRDADALGSRAKSQHLTAQVMAGLAISAAATALGIYIWEQLDP